ncbi:MAG: hypothetical protein Q7J40_01130 [Atribacterota bacterium]|nr:hypothetical protein [Atribacterota bacterium]
MTKKPLDILYSHYEDTFAINREHEKERDRLFLIIVGILGLLVLELMYSLVLSKAVERINFAGFSLHLTEIPLPVLVSLTWTFFSLLVLRYYQITVHVEKQYDYLQQLEQQLSILFNYPNIISRESSGYLTKKFSLFRHWIWIFYTVIYPIIVITAITWSLRLEYLTQSIPVYHRIYDTALGGLGIISMVLYLIGRIFNK